MRDLNLLNALPARGLVHNITPAGRWRVVSGNNRARLWQSGTRATIRTGVAGQQENAIKTISARNNGRGNGSSNGNAKKNVGLRRHDNTSSKSTAFDIADARAYCSVLLRKYDSAAFTLQTFIPTPARDAYLALRAFNIEIARVPDVTSNPTIGAMRLQFWRDAVRRALGSDSLQNNQDSDSTSSIRASENAEPVAILLASAVADLRARAAPVSPPSIDFLPPNRDFTGAWYPWLNRIITAREQYLNKRPYPTLDALETYAEDTYSVLMYLCLSSLPVASVEVDHVASHIGKAVGIATVLRGLPFLAFPSQGAGPAAWPLTLPQSSAASSPSSPSSPAQNSTIQEQQQQNNTDHPPDSPDVHQNNQGTIPIPLDVLASTNVREEDVFRCGSSAPNLRDAVFKVASRAYEHLITAHEMLESIRSNKPSGIMGSGSNSSSSSNSSDSSSADTENISGNDEVAKGSANSNSNSNSNFDTKPEIDTAFGILMQAIPTRLWLEKLQRVDFDIFDPRLRRQGWTLPWKAYWAFRNRRLMDRFD